MHHVDHTKNIIEVDNVSFSYAKGIDVLKHISLTIHQGDYIGLIGPNGAGKTTLLKVLLGLLTPQTGTVKLFGHDLRQFTDWHTIGYVPQKVAHFDVQFPATVFEAVLMGRTSSVRFFRRTTSQDKAAVENALRQVEMWDFRDRLIGDLSGGQQQRVFIARALVNQPRILFLDEPTTGVDQATQENFYALLRTLNRDTGLTLVLVSHDIERITQEAMHIACVDTTLTCHVSSEEYLSTSHSLNIAGSDVKVITHHHHT